MSIATHTHTQSYTYTHPASTQALNSRSRELEGLRSQWSSHTTSLTNDHAASLTAEREKLVQSQANAQRRQEEERREMERGHATRVSSTHCTSLASRMFYSHSRKDRPPFLATLPFDVVRL